MKKAVQYTVIALVFLCLSGCSRFRNPVVATVDGDKITASDLKNEMSMERGKYDDALLSQEPNFTAFRRQALDKLLQEQVLLAEAKRLGIKPTKEELREIDAMRSGGQGVPQGDSGLIEHGVDPKAWSEAQRRRITIGKLIDQEVLGKIPVTDEAIAAYYRQHLQEYSLPTQFRARQIIVDSRELAEQILARIKQGEDFADLAKTYSLSPDGRRGGDLGFFDGRSAPPIFTEICQQQKIGEVSDVVQTDYGYQIFQLLEKRPARQIPLEEAADAIRRLLREDGSEGAIEAWFEALRGKTSVAVNEEAVKGVTLGKTN